jgi:hypothetical protein
VDDVQVDVVEAEPLQASLRLDERILALGKELRRDELGRITCFAWMRQDFGDFDIEVDPGSSRATEERSRSTLWDSIGTRVVC